MNKNILDIKNRLIEMDKTLKKIQSNNNDSPNYTLVKQYVPIRNVEGLQIFNEILNTNKELQKEFVSLILLFPIFSHISFTIFFTIIIIYHFYTVLSERCIGIF